MALTNIGYIFFDLDDTLCAYWEASKKALRDTFDAHPLPGLTSEEIFETWSAVFREFSPSIKGSHWYPLYLRKGETTRIEQMRLMLERLGVNNESLAKRLSDFYAYERMRNLRLFEDALPVLEHLKPKFPLGIITNGPADVQREEISRLDIQSYFQHVFIEGEMGRGKPLPEVFEAIGREVEVLPERILFIGNSYLHDVQPALAAGWRAVWIRRASDVPPSRSNEHPEDRPAGSPVPDGVVHSLFEVVEMLG